MADGRKQLGSQTYQQHLDEMVEANLISSDTARAALVLGTSAPAGKRGKQGSG
jgi:hypothetical protein